MSILACLVCVIASCARNPDAEKARFVQRAAEYSSAGKSAEAVIELRNAVALAPQDGELRLLLAEAFLKSQDLGRAIGEFVRSADLLPARVDVQLKAGNLLLLTGRFDDARVRAEKGLALEPNHIDLHILLANSLAGLKDLDAAMVQIEEAIRLEPSRAATYANLGVLEIGRGKAQEAEKAFRRAVELDPASAPAQLAIANFYWMAGRLGDTEQALKRALAINPESAIAHRTLAAFAATTSRPAEAEVHLKRVVELTHSSSASLALADFYIWQRNHAAARGVLEPLTTVASAASPAKTRLASLSHAAGQRNEAYKLLDSVLAIDEGNLEALLTKNRLLIEDRRLDDALANAELTVELHDDSASAFHALGRVHALRREIEPAINAFQAAIRLNPRSTSTQVELAQLHLAAGRSSASLGLAEEAVKAEPGNGHARLVLVRGLIATGDLRRAESIVIELAAQFPRSSSVSIQQGYLLARRKDSTAARKSFEKALELDPSSVEAVSGLIALDLAAGQSASALRKVDELMGRNGRTVPALMLAGRTYLLTGDARRAEQMFRDALSMDPGHMAGYAALGQLYVSERRLDAALKEFDALVARNPRHVPALTIGAMLLEAQGRKVEAQQRYERVLQIDTSAPVAANNLAWLYAKSDTNLDMALQLARTAHGKLPDALEVADTLGYVYYKKNLLPQAIQILKETVSKDPSRYASHYHLGLAMARSGDRAGATQHLRQALRLSPDFDDAADAREQLRVIEER